MSTITKSGEMLVSWKVDRMDVNATLTWPDGAGPFPAVIFVAGSGPTDRNWNTPLLPGSNGSAALLAETLTRQGYVTLRYDKRASGPHLAQNMTQLMGKISMQGHADELAGGVKLLAAREDVDSDRIFVLANSEGCVHALNYHLQTEDLPFAGIILTAPPSRPMGEVARGQIAAQLNPIPGGDQLLAAYDAVIADFTAGRPVKIDESLPEGLKMVLKSVTNPINQPFSSELWATDASLLLKQVKVPVLVIIGKKDIQVDWQTDGCVVEKIAQSHANITLLYPENANHVLKHEPRERSQFSAADATNEYNAEQGVLDKETVKMITSWLAAQM